ncbi:probable G-protein coupled receptor Mth-like 1 [Uranotaenia lowii]|uniref:probable G-protein coupled receptor Mth-like 1 n=1 Tax=Uranotaenia lowii TaxID=190385 RepID=UPI00247B0DF9|nr:probable G-protein coupled receptor Mth-like 1 [Uranotaenia lowii]
MANVTVENVDPVESDGADGIQGNSSLIDGLEESESMALNDSSLSVEYFPEAGHTLWYIIGGVTCIGLLWALLVMYLVIPNLKTVRRLPVCSYIFGQILIYLCFLLTSSNSTLIPCEVTGLVYPYAVFACIFWMNVMCYGCYSDFKSKKIYPTHSLFWQSMFGWGAPTVLLLFYIFTNGFVLLDVTTKPPFSAWMCHEHMFELTPILKFFYLPTAALMVLNTIFLGLATISRANQRYPYHIEDVDSHINYRRDRQERFQLVLSLFVALFVVYGSDLAAWVGGTRFLWLHYFAGFFAYLHGCIVFVVCVLNRDIREWIVSKCEKRCN